MIKDTVIFTNGNLFSLIILSDFILENQNRIAKIVIINGDYKGRKGWYAYFNYFKSNSIIYLIYKIFTISLIKFLKIFTCLRVTSVLDIASELKIDWEIVHDVNNEDLFKKIKQLYPKYLLSVSCPQLIQKKWLELFNYQGINIHSSMLPSYAGLAPYFWVLSLGEKETGVSVHYLSKGFDKGNILAQEKIHILKSTSSFSLFTNQCIIGKSLLIEAYKKMIVQHTGTLQNLNNYSYYSHPTTKAYFKLRANKHRLFRFSDLRKLIHELKKIQQKIDHLKNGKEII